MALLDRGPRKPINKNANQSFVNRAGTPCYIRGGAVALGTPDADLTEARLAEAWGKLEDAPRNIRAEKGHVTSIPTWQHEWRAAVSDGSGTVTTAKTSPEIRVGATGVVYFNVSSTPSEAAGHSLWTVQYCNDEDGDTWNTAEVMKVSNGASSAAAALSCSGGYIITRAPKYRFTVSAAVDSAVTETITLDWRVVY